MKALININTQESSWAGQYFPDHSLYTLSVAAKPLGEYYLDFCCRLEVEAEPKIKQALLGMLERLRSVSE